MKYHGVELGVDFAGVHFENPFILSAAPPSDDLEMVRNAFKAGWAGAVLKTTSVETENVNLVYPMMSSVDYDASRIMGLGNIDLISEHHINELEKRVTALKQEFPTKVVIVSIMGSRKEEWQGLVRCLESAGVDIIECSFSCPQGSMGEEPGAMLAQSIESTEKVAGWVKEAAKRVPVVIKITPQVTSIVKVARAVKRGGADAICASNTIPSLMGINLDNFVPYPNVDGYSTYSGYSGPAIKPITLRTIAEIKRNVDILITGTGGPTTWKDAIEFFAVGATTVQFATAVMHYGYDIIDDLTSGVSYFMKDKGITRVSDMIGISLEKVVNHEDLPREHQFRARIDEDECVLCGECYTACTDGGHTAYTFDDNTKPPIVDDDKCVGCNLCITVCPTKAITLKAIN